MQKNFSGYYSIIQKQEDIVKTVRIISSKQEGDTSEGTLTGSEYDNLYHAFTQDKSQKKRSFNKILKKEILHGLGFLKKTIAALEEKKTQSETAIRELERKKSELYARWSTLKQEKDLLQKQNNHASKELAKYLSMKNRLSSKREYINYKYQEYGDAETIKRLFDVWSKEYEQTIAEEKGLRSEYNKARQDERTIPQLCHDIEKNMKHLNDEISFAKYEMEETFKAIPDIEELVQKSQDIVLKYREVHKKYEETGKVTTELREKFEKIDSEKTEIEQTLSVKKEELAPFNKTEAELKTRLADMTNKFNTQKELKEQDKGLKQVVGPLEKTIKEWKERIAHHEKKTADQNAEIEQVKGESHATLAKLKEIEALIGPTKELKERLKSAKEEIAAISDQDKRLTDEIHSLRKANDLLSIKAKQFEMVKKKMEGMK